MDRPDNCICSVTQHGTFSALSRWRNDYRSLPTITVGELLKSGASLGVGAAVDANGHIVGEVTMIDGVAYCTGRDGKSRVMETGDTLAFAQFADVPPTVSQSVALQAETPDALVAQLQELLPEGQRDAFVMQLHGRFHQLHYRTINSAEGEYEDFTSLLDDAARFRMRGPAQLAGIYQKQQLPDGTSPEGWHFHAVTDDRESGGHVLDFAGFTGTVTIMPIKEWHVSTQQAVQRFCATEKTGPMVCK